MNERLTLPGFFSHATAGWMAPGRAWARVLSRRAFTPLIDPHPATAAVELDGATYCSSVLPWRGCGPAHPWTGATHGDRTRHVIDQLRDSLPHGPLIWGGDWNHALSGAEHAGSKAGREHALALARDRGLQIPTAELPHHIADLLSIDHIAIPNGWRADASRIAAEADGVRLSDHDAYVVDAVRA